MRWQVASHHLFLGQPHIVQCLKCSAPVSAAGACHLLWTFPGTKPIRESVFKGGKLNSDEAEDYEIRITDDTFYKSPLQHPYETGLHAYI